MDNLEDNMTRCLGCGKEVVLGEEGISCKCDNTKIEDIHGFRNWSNDLWVIYYGEYVLFIYKEEQKS